MIMHNVIIHSRALMFLQGYKISFRYRQTAKVVKQFPDAETCFFRLLIINGLIFLELRKSVDLAAVSPLICNLSSLQSYRGLFGGPGLTSYLPSFLTIATLIRNDTAPLAWHQSNLPLQAYLMIITDDPNLIFLLFLNYIWGRSLSCFS